MKKIVFLIILISSAAKAELTPVQKLEEASLRLRNELLSLNPSPVPREKLDVLDKRFEEMLNERFRRIANSRADFARGDMYYKSRFATLFFDTYKRLKNDGKIFYLTKEISEKLKLDNYLCNSSFSCQKGCRKLNGFYLHAVDFIFLNAENSEEDFEKALFHEVLHSYQYVYRFPLDVAMLSALAASGRIQQKDFLNYLSFAYESQANWYVLGIDTSEVWQQELMSKAKKRGNRFAYSARNAPKRVFGNLFQGYADSPNFQGRDEDRLMSKLPLVDSADADRLYPAFVYPSKEPNALYFNELVVLNETGTLFTGNVDIEFHKKYAKALECTYYGDLTFLFQDQSDDQLIFKELNDNYYNLVLLSAPVNLSRDNKVGGRQMIATFAGVQDSKECSAVTNSIQNKDTAPLIGWLKQTSSNGCVRNDRFFSANIQNKIAERYLSSANSPFELGIEGGGGGIEIHPQLEVLPLKETMK